MQVHLCTGRGAAELREWLALRLATAIGIAKRKMTSRGRCLVSCTGSTDAVSGVASDKLRVEIAMHSAKNEEGTDFRTSGKFGSLLRSQGSISCFPTGQCMILEIASVHS